MSVRMGFDVGGRDLGAAVRENWHATLLPVAMLLWKALLIACARQKGFGFEGHEWMWCALTTTLWGIAQHGGVFSRPIDLSGAVLLVALVFGFGLFALLVLLGPDPAAAPTNADRILTALVFGLGLVFWLVGVFAVLFAVQVKRAAD